MPLKLPVPSGLYKYSRLTKNTTDYAKRMDRLSKRIFNEVAKPTAETNLRVVKRFSERPLDLRPEIVDYYPRHPETQKLMTLLRSYGLYRDEHQDFVEEMERLRQLRGKGKTNRGKKTPAVTV